MRIPNLHLIVVQVWNKSFRDDIFARSAQLAYYWLFSLFPLLIFMTSLLAFLPTPMSLTRWINALHYVLPPDAFALVRNTFNEIISQPRSGLLSISIAVSIWAASSGMDAIINALDRAYNAPAPRDWWWQRTLAIALTIGLAAFIISGLTIIFFGERISNQLGERYGYSHIIRMVWSYTQWPIAVSLLLLGLELIYYFAPNVSHIKNRHGGLWFTPGASIALVLWGVISYGFRLYVAHFGRYNVTYGTLGGVMILMLWFYLTGLAILIGGEINSVTRKAYVFEVDDVKASKEIAESRA